MYNPAQFVSKKKIRCKVGPAFQHAVGRWSLAVKKGGIAGTSRAVILPLARSGIAPFKIMQQGSCTNQRMIADDCWKTGDSDDIWDIYSNLYLTKCITVTSESWSLPHLTPCQSRLLQHLVPQTLGFFVGEDSDGDETKGPHPPNATLTPNPCLRSHCSHCKFPVWEEAADLFFDDLWRPGQKPLKKSSNHRSNEGGWVAGIIPGLTSPGYTSTSPTTAVSLGIRFGYFGVTACYSVAVLACSCARFLEFEILLRI